MLHIILIGAMLDESRPEPQLQGAPPADTDAGREVWRWRCTSGVDRHSGASFPAKKPRAAQ